MGSRVKFFLFLVLSLPMPLIGDPWGKDAELVYISKEMRTPPPPCCPRQRHSPLSQVGQKMICFHKNVISPADGPRSHHYPNSSGYTLCAMKKYGFFYGIVLGCDRLMRENNDPWIYKFVEGESGPLKYDPVP